jgi:hypothetical protein
MVLGEYRFSALARAATIFSLSVALALATLPQAPAMSEASSLPPGGTFWDDDGNPHEGMIEAIVAEGITEGCSSDGRNYCPRSAVNRGQMATFLARALDLPPATQDHFPDTAGNTHEDNINRVAEAGIAAGRTDGKFHPSDPVTRAQMATFLAVALELPTASREGRFRDVTGTHSNNIDRVAEAGITQGCNAEGTLFCPSDAVSRAQMASFLGRALDLTPIVPAPRALTEGVRTVTRWLDVLGDVRLGRARDLSVGPARSYVEYLIRADRIASVPEPTSYTVTSDNTSARDLGDRRWRLDLEVRWHHSGETSMLTNFVVRQRADGTFRLDNFARAGVPLGSYVRVGNIAQSQSGRPVTATLVAQFRRADLPQPEVVNIVAVKNNRDRVTYVDDWMAGYTTRADNRTYNAYMGEFPGVPAGRTRDVLLPFGGLRTPYSSADLYFMAYGPHSSGYEFEQLVSLRVPAWQVR